MPSWLKSTIQYTVSLSLGILLVWYVFKDKHIGEILSEIKEANFSWIVLSMIIAVISHIARAYRWNLLLEPIGYKPALKNSFFAVMVGYLANIVFPRMGEVTRCAILKKTNSIPVNNSFGTVVTERIFDLLVLISIVLLTLVIEFDKLFGFVSSIFSTKVDEISDGISSTLIYAGIGSIILILLLIFIVIKIVRTKYADSSFLLKIGTFLRGLAEGALSFRKLKRKKQFFISTVFIWVCYYYMSYLIFFSLPATSNLGFGAGMAVLVLGGLGMAAPLQAGVGTYWVLQNGLILYGLTEAEGLTYATVLHLSQTLMMIIVGLTSLVITTFFIKNRPTEFKGDGIQEEFRQNINA